MQALEEEGNAEKHQLAAMHQQRVLAHINQRKREAMTCYTQALTEQIPNVSKLFSMDVWVCRKTFEGNVKITFIHYLSRRIALRNVYKNYSALCTRTVLTLWHIIVIY